MEDILEELVGEIEDEFDAERPEEVSEEGGRLVMEGNAPVRALAERLGIELTTHHEATVGGYVSEYLGRVPAAGETVACLGRCFEVLEVEETRILRVAVGIEPLTEEQEAALDRRDGGAGGADENARTDRTLAS